MNSSITSTIPTAEQFQTRIRSFRDGIVALAADYAVSLNTRPELRAELVELGEAPLFLDWLEKVGRGDIHPCLAYQRDGKEKRLAACPRSVQDHVLQHGVPVLDPDGSDRLIPFNDLTPDQCVQVFHGGIQRSLGQQKTWLCRRRSRIRSASEPRFSKGAVIYMGVRITRHQIAQWAKELGI